MRNEQNRTLALAIARTLFVNNISSWLPRWEYFYHLFLHVPYFNYYNYMYSTTQISMT